MSIENIEYTVVDIGYSDILGRLAISLPIFHINFIGYMIIWPKNPCPGIITISNIYCTMFQQVFMHLFCLDFRNSLCYNMEI